MRRGYEPFIKGDKFKFNDGQFTEIYEIENKSDYIAKEVKLTFEAGYMLWEKRKESLESAIKLIKARLGQFVPEFSLVYGHGKNGNETPYIFCLKVDPKADLNKEDIQRYIDQYDEFLSALADLYKDSFNGDRGIMLDVLEKPKNFIYGTTSKDHEPRLYMVDIYPTFTEPPRIAAQTLEYIANDPDIVINGNEYKLNSLEGIKNDFHKTRKASQELIELAEQTKK